MILNAFNDIVRSRRYESGTPLPLGMRSVKDYLEINESPCELYIFIPCIIKLDNIFIDKSYKKISNKKPSK